MARTGKLMAIIDPTSAEQAALDRAVRLAVDTRGSVHAFCCVYLSEQQMADFPSRKDAKHHELNRILRWLDDLAKPIAAQGVSITTEAYWNENWYDSACHAAARHGASMIVKNTEPHTTLARKLSRTSDYTLLRYAPCPVLLTKSDDDWINGRILAAVAMNNRDPEHEILNNTIVTEAQRLARATGFELHLVSVHYERADIANVLNILVEEDASFEDVIAERFGVPPAHVHIKEDPYAKNAIIDTAREVAADVLVIGTIARKGLQGALLGNTAEKVLDELDIDILTVN